MRLVAVTEPVPIDADAAQLIAALLPAVRAGLHRSASGPLDFGSTLKGSESEYVLSLWLRDRGEVVPRDRLSKLLADPGTSLDAAARDLGGRAWAESTAGLGTVLGVDLPVPDRA